MVPLAKAQEFCPVPAPVVCSTTQPLQSEQIPAVGGGGGGSHSGTELSGGSPLSERPLILYAYYETVFGRANLQFFVDHGLHGAADFIFVLNGKTDVDTEIIFKDNTEEDEEKRFMGNIRVVKRENTCFDLGAHREVLESVPGGEGWSTALGPLKRDGEGDGEAESEKREEEEEGGKSEEGSNVEGEGEKKMKAKVKRTEASKPKQLKERYKRFILMNASIRGPFVPPWSRECWSDAYLGKLTHRIKVRLSPPLFFFTSSLFFFPAHTLLPRATHTNPHPQLVGMSYNCHSGRGHIQSMIWATDSVALPIILSKEGIGECFPDMPAAQQGEVRTTKLLRDKGYDVEPFLAVYHSKDRATRRRRIKAKKEAGILTTSGATRRSAHPNTNAQGEQKRGTGMTHSHPGIHLSAAELAALDLDSSSSADSALDPLLITSPTIADPLHPPDRIHSGTPTGTSISSWESALAAAKAALTEADAKLTPDELAAKEAARQKAKEEMLAKQKAAAVLAEEIRVAEEVERKAQEEEEKKKKEELERKAGLEEDVGDPGWWWRECTDEDYLGRDSYFGSFVHPYENLFMKSHRGIEDGVLEHLSEWHDGWGKGSWGVCR
jgi:hypothetical protein